MTACVIVRVSYRSQSVSNFHSSFSTATKNCLMPSSVSSSRLTRTLTGSVMNLWVISRTSWGSVADTRTTCREVTACHYVPGQQGVLTCLHTFPCSLADASSATPDEVTRSCPTEGQPGSSEQVQRLRSCPRCQNLPVSQEVGNGRHHRFAP